MQCVTWLRRGVASGGEGGPTRAARTAGQNGRLSGRGWGVVRPFGALSGPPGMWGSTNRVFQTTRHTSKNRLNARLRPQSVVTGLFVALRQADHCCKVSGTMKAARASQTKTRIVTTMALRSKIRCVNLGRCSIFGRAPKRPSLERGSISRQMDHRSCRGFSRALLPPLEIRMRALKDCRSHPLLHLQQTRSNIDGFDWHMSESEVPLTCLCQTNTNELETG